MASESEAAEMQSVLERLINSRTRDLSLFIPFLLGFTTADPGPTRTDSGPNSTDPDPDSDNPSTPDHHHRRDRIILINPLTQGMVVIEGTRLDALFHNSPEKSGQPPASKSAIEAMPSVEIREGDEGECVICLDEWVIGGIVKEMPCKHRFHGDCIEKWLKMHGSCPVCRHTMPAEEEEGGKKQEEERENQNRERRREIWVSFSVGSPRRRTEEAAGGGGDVNRPNSSDSGDQVEERESEMGN